VTIRAVDEPAVRALLSDEVVWTCLNKDGEEVQTRNNLPSRELINDVAALGADRGDFRRLLGTAAAPYLAGPPGKLRMVKDPGYDPATEVWLADHGLRVDVPANPAQADAIAARDTLLGLVDEVPFKSDVDRAVFLAMAMMPFALKAMGGKGVPPVVIDADGMNAGKSRLAQLVAQLATGDTIGQTGYNPDDAEMVKALVSLAIAGDSIVIWDDIVTGTPIGGSALNRAATSNEMIERKLGGNTMHRGPFRPFMMFTVNHGTLKDDFATRVLRCRLNHPGGNRETPFRIPDTAEHLREHRGRYVSAILTMLLAYDAAGRPKVRKVRFRDYDDLVLSAVVWADMPDPYLSNMQAMADTMSHAQPLADLALQEPFTINGKRHRFTANSIRSPSEPLYAALCALTDGDPHNKTTIRKALMGCVNGQPFTLPNGHRVTLKHAKNPRSNVAEFWWHPVDV
jgi:hypothetical protein